MTDKNRVSETVNSMDFSGMQKPTRLVWGWWIALITVMVSFYIFFNGHS